MTKEHEENIEDRQKKKHVLDEREMKGRNGKDGKAKCILNGIEKIFLFFLSILSKRRNT